MKLYQNLQVFFSVVLLTLIVVIAGRLPDDFIEWSADGSVGFIEHEGQLMLIDGHTYEKTLIADGYVAQYPSITDNDLVLCKA